MDPKVHHNNLIQSILAKIAANHAGADQALMLDRSGFIAEAHGTHVFFVRRDKVFTGTTEAWPKGITRQTVLDLCAANGIEHEVGKVSLTEAYAADEMSCIRFSPPQPQG